jgi:hypothetical protein
MAKRMFRPNSPGRVQGQTTDEVMKQAAANIAGAQRAGILPTPKSKGRPAKAKAPVRTRTPANPNASLETSGAFF